MYRLWVEYGISGAVIYFRMVSEATPNYFELMGIAYRIVQKFDGENLTNLTNGQRFVKVFSSNLFPVNAFPMKPTINL